MSFYHPLPQLLGKLGKGCALRKLRQGKAASIGTQKGGPSTPALASRGYADMKHSPSVLGLPGAPMHGQDVSWQLPSPQHNVQQA